MRRLLIAAAMIVAATGCGSKKDPFAPVPECMGPSVVPFMGGRQIVLASLAIADADEGFDLDLDGKPDNKLSPLAALANDTIKQSFTTKHDIVLPIELFGYDGADSACTKFSFYVGKFNKDRDADGKDTTWDKGDCDDTDAAVHPGATEDLTNRVDDDCDGLADNMTPGSKPTDTTDMDGDGFSLAQGDCDDRSDAAHLAAAKARHPMAMDVCDDGIDQDCDGIPDNDPSCDPFKANNVTVNLQDVSFDAAMQPLITFKDGAVKNGVMLAGPDKFSLNIPFQKNITLALDLTGTRVQMDLVDVGGKTSVPLVGTDGKAGGRLGGVLAATTLSQIKGIDAGGVIKADQSLLDAIFAGAVGTVLGLDTDKEQHYQPDIDVDGDGLEAFWQETPGAGSPHVDTCKDGDGTIVRGLDCPMAKDAKGNFRFVDGLSVALKFSAVPVKVGSVVGP
ncbi:MAG: putative lipoprotein [Myxococcales bacterium]|nr:putative lipoprotein [Myxococcales bacterium]